MSSGMKVAENVKKLVVEMQVNRKEDLPEKRIRILTLSINEEKGEIEEENIVREEQLAQQENTYTYLQTLLKDEDCKYVIYDCHYETTRGKMEDLVFMMWSSDCAKTRKKMPYASSKNCLKKIVAAKHEFEFHDREEIAPRCFACSLGKVTKAKITALEGLDISDP